MKQARPQFEAWFKKNLVHTPTDKECNYFTPVPEASVLAPSFKLSLQWKKDSIEIKCAYFFLKIAYEHREYDGKHFCGWTQLNFDSGTWFFDGDDDLKKRHWARQPDEPRTNLCLLSARSNDWYSGLRLLEALCLDTKNPDKFWEWDQIEISKEGLDLELALNACLNTLLVEMKFGKKMFF